MKRLRLEDVRLRLEAAERAIEDVVSLSDGDNEHSDDSIGNPHENVDGEEGLSSDSDHSADLEGELVGHDDGFDSDDNHLEPALDLLIPDNDHINNEDANPMFEEVPIVPEEHPVTREEQVEYLRRFLGDWAVRGIAYTKVDELLGGLRVIFPELRKSWKTLLNTSSINLDIRKCGEGLLWYKGFRLNLTQRLTEAYLENKDEIIVEVNIDGLEFIQSGSDCFWPILGCLKGLRTPFIIAVYFGVGKPTDLKSFLRKFIREARELQQQGYEAYGRIYPFRLGNFILDAPARAFVKCCIGHTGKVACEKCDIVGQSMYNRVVFVGVPPGHLRTDESFKNKEQPEHHKGTSPLESKLGIGMVSQFRLDTMHLVYAGVFKRWLMYLFGMLHRNETAEEAHVRRQNRRAGIKQPKFKPHGAVSSAVKNAINDTLLSLRASMPCEFNRRPRSLIYMSFLKCTELRRILLYDGPRIFKNNIPSDSYKHYLLLHVGMYILCNPKFVRQHKFLCVARYVLDEFVDAAPAVFDESFNVYNVHSLKHLADECEQHGDADSFSAFKYENMLGLMGHILRSGFKPLQQLGNRDMERNGWLWSSKGVNETVDLEQVCLDRLRREKVDEDYEGDQYKRFICKGSTLSFNVADWCFSTSDGDICLFTNAINTPNGEILLAGFKFESQEDYYDFPIKSSELGILKVSRLSDTKSYWNLHKFEHKCVLLRDGDAFLCIPMIQSRSQ